MVTPPAVHPRVRPHPCIVNKPRMYLYLAFVCSLLLPLTFSCSCPFNPSITRYDAICDAFSSSWVKSVYKARVLSAFCNCIVTSSSNQFSCIQFYTGPQGHVIGNVEETYQCDISRLYYYDECPSIAMKAGTGKFYSLSYTPLSLFPFSYLICCW